MIPAADRVGRVAVVTGAASGIGRGLAQRCADAGMRVVLADVDERALIAARDVLAAGGADVRAHRTDVSLAADVAALAEATFSAFGAVHLVCNNAGVGLRGLVWERTLADWEWVLGVNLWGVVHGLHEFVPRMLAQGGPAHVVNTASIAGLVTGPRSSIYATSKFAVVALSESLRHDLRAVDAPIGVSVVCPGWVRTGIVDAGIHRPARLVEATASELSAEEVALEAATRAGIATGMDPLAVADRVLDAVATDRFWVFTHPEYEDAIRRRVDEAFDERNTTVPPTQSTAASTTIGARR